MKRIFLSYDTHDRPTAERIALALGGDGYRVFFDRPDIAAGENFTKRLRDEIHACHLFVFLVSPHSVEKGSYTLTELKAAEERWRHPSFRVLPVVVRETDLATIPAYLRAATMLEPVGDAAADVGAAVARLFRERRRAVLRRVLLVGGSLTAGAALGIALAIAKPEIFTRAETQVDLRARLESIGVDFTPDALVDAATSGDRVAVDLLLRAGMDPNAMGRGTWALPEAAREGQVEIVEQLLDAGAAPGYSLILVVGLTDGRMFERILAARPDKESLNDAARRAARVGRVDRLGRLLDHGADIDHSEDGQTILMSAASTGQVDVVRALLDAGANIHLRDADGRTALDHAEAGGQTTVARLLREGER